MLLEALTLLLVSAHYLSVTIMELDLRHNEQVTSLIWIMGHWRQINALLQQTACPWGSGQDDCVSILYDGVEKDEEPGMDPVESLKSLWGVAGEFLSNDKKQKLLLILTNCLRSRKPELGFLLETLSTTKEQKGGKIYKIWQ